MLRIGLSILVMSATWVSAAEPAAGLSKEEADQGFVSLFDGKKLDGWKGAVDGYVPENGLLVCQKKGGGNVLTVKAERPDPVGEGTELIASERPRGVFSRQLILGDALDTDGVKANYDAGVLTLRIPVAEKAKPRRIEIETTGKQRQEINA